ncbi:NAD-dependent epimerase/dehydratase family protein [Leptospira koniambonensis]|uniref:NAD-dependent epimerase/dehydratase family protein n=1 Tax=Leptospira koniambonensis TaxID=2484950 RepID=A0A4R9J6F2_9LEPT|nr:NmrA family NAD(P)-binding protein [Leptospira koniambonensis]TGL33768.1 NAD-dependent epimerase/dehydratase family protein [Leptospira koniambonensis]
MKIVITGSLGHISKPLTIDLLKKGHSITVISSNAKKKNEIEALGAKSAIGSLEDLNFLTETFKGVDAVYCMIPPNDYFDHELDLISFYKEIGTNYAQAIQKSGVKRVVHLSSIGAHLEKNSGIIVGHHFVENILKELSGVGLTHMRPTAFYYNLYGFLARIKKEGRIASNYGGEDRVPWVSPIDIAQAVAEEIVTPLEGRKIIYVASDEPTCNEIANALGAEIGKPDLKWELISDEEMQNHLKAIGMSPSIVKGFTEMNASMHNGTLMENYYRNRPVSLGKVKLTEFAKEFASVFHQN